MLSAPLCPVECVLSPVECASKAAASAKKVPQDGPALCTELVTAANPYGRRC